MIFRIASSFRGDGGLCGGTTSLRAGRHLCLVGDGIDGPDAGGRDRVGLGCRVLGAGEIGEPDGACESDNGEAPRP